MNSILLGNGIALFGAVLMAAIGLIKQRKHILATQCVQFGIMGIANLILGGINGFVSALVSITRNLICLKWELTTPIKIGIISIQAVLALSIDRSGVYWHPAGAVCLYLHMVLGYYGRNKTENGHYHSAGLLADL